MFLSDNCQSPHKSEQKPKTITKIVFQKKRTDRRSVFLDDVYAFSVSEQTFQRFPLAVSQTLSDNQIFVIKTHEEFEAAKVMAVRYLAIRMRSEFELRTYLRKKEFSKRIIERTLLYCKERAYVNDEQYAEMLVRDMININHYGENKMRLMLRKRGISNAIIENVAADQIDQDIQLEIALKLAKKKIVAISDPLKVKERLYRFLKQRGFTYPIISQVFNKL